MPLPNEQGCGNVVVESTASHLLSGCLLFPVAVLYGCLTFLSSPAVGAESNPDSAGEIGQEDHASDVDPGATYHAGTRLRIPGTAWSFVVPDQWQSTRPADSDMPLLMAQNGTGLGMIFPLADVTREAVRAELSQPLSLLHGLSFVPAGALVETETSIARSYQGEDLLGRALAALGPENRCVIYFIMGPREDAADFETSLERLGASTRFADPMPGPEMGL